MGRFFAVAIFLVIAWPAAGQDALAPPPGARKLFEARAKGVQVYVCQEKRAGDQGETGFAWDLAGPDAALFGEDNLPLGRHAKGPSWILNDGSSVTAEPIAKAPAPGPGAIPWLLLKVTAHEGKGRLDGVTFIRRVETSGGIAPGSGCGASRRGETARIPYTAVYQFYGP